MNLSEIEQYSFSPEGFKPHVKSPIIWGHKGNTLFPLCYLTKPKSVPDELWQELVAQISFTISVNKAP